VLFLTVLNGARAFKTFVAVTCGVCLVIGSLSFVAQSADATSVSCTVRGDGSQSDPWQLSSEFDFECFDASNGTTWIRLERNSDIGNAKDNDYLAEQIAAARDQLCRDLAAVFISARTRGLIRPDADPLSIASFYLTFTHGVSLWELGPEFVSREQLTQTLKEVLFSMLFD
jgi:hypothetical protein